ncbi:cupin-like domain-containing protein [Sphingomonas sp. SM33]|uniref:Cupin-like domain-containing protein n=1 Tax=Sphingomonas telluris TaxID=2907998 RepID=A0ABS9VQI9_9SPHN|nr:cupin-like domain-containing protein [Sphingomonas telluris]MCH8616968.1 cupin-like domain-containing protein [Sphingomonas telluris]
MRSIPEWTAPSVEVFRAEILPTARPAVLRQVVRSWPLVQAARHDPRECMAMLSAHASDAPVEVLRADPGEQGRFHYSADGRSLNFIRGRGNLSAFLGALDAESRSEEPHALVVQGLVAERHVPGFPTSHPLPLVPASAEPRLWIGNAAKVATHNDPVDNIAVVAAGRRRFTLFPPSAEPDLYMGPEHPTPAGTPVSMVHVTAPDFDRYPRFEEALKVAESAELSPGDAIFIPRDWYHHVEALERFNILVNYWWDASA